MERKKKMERDLISESTLSGEYRAGRSASLASGTDIAK